MKTLIARSLLSTALLAGMAYGADAGSARQQLQIHYKVELLTDNGGTKSAGNSINDLGWVSGNSNLTGDAVTHATLWRNGVRTDLGTLGGAGTNSAVLWPVKNIRGVVTGITQTDVPDPNNENWSCFFFFPDGTQPGKQCVGFKWQNGVMTALPPFAGGTHSFATGSNNWGQTVGWAENGVVDTADCTAPQKLLFRAAIWGPGKNQMRELPPLAGDKVSSATAINDRGQVVGISGACSNAVGGLSAKRSVIWENGRPTRIDDFGGIAWNTPMAINQRGDVVGFANRSEAVGTLFRPNAFLWIKGQPLKRLPLLPEQGPEARGQALGINEWRQVVGTSCDSRGQNCRAVLWQNGVLTDLNTLVSPSGTAVLTIANDIDNLGRISGTALHNGKEVAYKATPFLTAR